MGSLHPILRTCSSKNDLNVPPRFYLPPENLSGHDLNDYDYYCQWSWNEMMTTGFFFFIDHESSCHYVCRQESVLLRCKSHGSLLCSCYFLQALIIVRWFWKKKIIITCKDRGNCKIASCIIMGIIILLLLILFMHTGNSVVQRVGIFLTIIAFYSFLTSDINMCFNMK